MLKPMYLADLCLYRSPALKFLHVRGLCGSLGSAVAARGAARQAGRQAGRCLSSQRCAVQLSQPPA